MATYTVNAYNNGGTGGSVNMRSGPSTNDDIIIQVPHGATVTGTKSGTWSYMTYQETYSGYMMSVYLDEQAGGTTGGGTYLGTGTVIGGGPLYCRKQPVAGYEYWGQFQEGATIEIYSCSTPGWYETRWNGSNVGYVMSNYIQVDGAGTSGGIYIGTGTVVGGGPLYCRKQPIAGYEYWGQFQEGTTIQLYTCATSGWYETRWPVGGSNIGYVMSNYISTSGGSSSGGTTITFNPNAAVEYARGHSETTENALCSNRNTSFGSSTTNDCANFVSQCLVAGGLPMFDGWCYKLSGIPTSWETGGWSWTYSGYLKLNSKGRISQVALTDVQPGDFIYNYDSSMPAGKQYTHVTLAVSTYQNGGVYVCGHTKNQNNVFRALSSSNCRCYRVNSTITVGADEKRVLLNATGSGYTVL